MIHTVSEWKWFGSPAHFICGRWCRFHLCTLVGPWLVSTVGEYIHPRHAQGSEQAESEYLVEHPFGEEIGCNRLFETMVFRAGAPCTEEGCQCGLPELADAGELDSRGYNTRGDATKGHHAMCLKWADKEGAA